MKGRLNLCFISGLCALAACAPEMRKHEVKSASDSKPILKEKLIGTYTVSPPLERFYQTRELNLLYIGNNDLAGIRIDHNTPNDAPRDSSVHPSAIHYFFWNGSVDLVSYGKDGVINWSNSYWYYARNAIHWRDVDFSFGSDPGLKRHHIPFGGE